MRSRNYSRRRTCAGFPGHSAGGFHVVGACHASGRRARGGPQRRIPAPHSGDLYGLVQRAPYPAWPAGGSRLRAAGILPRAHPRSAAGGQPGLLPDGRQPRHPAAPGGGGYRPPGWHRLRRQVGRQRRGAQAQPQNQLLRSHGELLGVFHPQTPSYSRGARNLRTRGRRVQLYRAASAARPRHSGNHLLPGGGPHQRRTIARHLRKAVRRRAVCPAVQPRPHTRSARRGAYQLLRYRRHPGRQDRARGGGQRHRQPGQRRGGPGGPEYESHAGASRNPGLAVEVVVKVGGTLLDSAESRDRLAAQIAAARGRGIEMVVVHGGGKQMTRYLAERGIESRFVGGLRVTSPETLDAVLKVFAGSVNHQLVASLNRAGAPAVGLSGIDAFLVEAEQLDPAQGAVGRVTKSNPSFLELLTCNGYLPVVACVAGDRQGQVYNVNADQMGVACAAAFGASQLIFLTDVEGVLDGAGRVRPVLTVAESRRLIADGVATGGMQAKLEAALAALTGGVEQVRIAPGAAEGVLERVLAGDGIGTRMAFGEAPAA